MPATHLIVFRDTSELVSGHELAHSLKCALEKIGDSAESVLAVLIVAGQIESALEDCNWPTAAKAGAFTDALASLFVNCPRTGDHRFLDLASEIASTLPDQVRISHPEGFAYYALHPGDFVDAVGALADQPFVAVVGIRSIGTTLSACATAELLRQGRAAERITVRPVGHPYDRKTQFTASQSRWIEEQRRRDAIFLITDEGPGLSGSSFLSVAESLVQLGVRAERITLLGTREVDPEQLCTRDAGLRWRQFRRQTVSSRIYSRFSGMTPLSGGAWRQEFLASERDWPACWKEMESVRFLSPDRQSIFKFEGFGSAGEHARERGGLTSKAGFGLFSENAGDGMTCYQFFAGRPLLASDLSVGLLDHIARYCAFRASEFKVPRANNLQLEEMVCFNFHQETGCVLDLPVGSLASESAIIADGRMQPYEWIRARDGRILKVDASTHGDNHFLPGPTDISWDLAGAIVEWQMSRDAADYLVASFRKHGGITSSQRLSSFILAYSIFRQSYCQMAHNASQDAAEKRRLQQAITFYRNKMLICGASRLASRSDQLTA